MANEIISLLWLRNATGGRCIAPNFGQSATMMSDPSSRLRPIKPGPAQCGCLRPTATGEILRIHQECSSALLCRLIHGSSHSQSGLAPETNDPLDTRFHQIAREWHVVVASPRSCQARESPAGRSPVAAANPPVSSPLRSIVGRGIPHSAFEASNLSSLHG